jgi:hypothetical protein
MGHQRFGKLQRGLQIAFHVQISPDEKLPEYQFVGRVK